MYLKTSAWVGTNKTLRIMNFVLSVKLRVIISHPNLFLYFGHMLLNITFINCSWVIAVIYKVYCMQYFTVRWSTIVMWATVNSEFFMDRSNIYAMLGRDYFVDKHFKLSPTYNSSTKVLNCYSFLRKNVLTIGSYW